MDAKNAPIPPTANFAKPAPLADTNNALNDQNGEKQVDDLLALTKFDMDLSATAGFTTLQLAELYLTTVTTAYVDEFDGLKQLLMQMKLDGKIDIAEDEIDSEINKVLTWITGKIPKRVVAVRRCAALLLSGQLQAQATAATSSSSTVTDGTAVLSPGEFSGNSQDLHATAAAVDDPNREITLKDIREAWQKRTVLLQKLDEMNNLASELAQATRKLKCSMGAAEQELNGAVSSDAENDADVEQTETEAEISSNEHATNDQQTYPKVRS